MPQDLRSFSRSMAQQYGAPDGTSNTMMNPRSGQSGGGAPAPPPAQGGGGGGGRAASAPLPSAKGSYLPQQPMEVTVGPAQPPGTTRDAPLPPPDYTGGGISDDPGTGEVPGLTDNPGFEMMPPDFSYQQPGTQFKMKPQIDPLPWGWGPIPDDYIDPGDMRHENNGHGWRDPGGGGTGAGDKETIFPNVPENIPGGYDWDGDGEIDNPVGEDAEGGSDPYRDYLNDLLTGDGASFDPIRESMQTDLERNLRRHYEAMGGRGMNASGAGSAMAGDIVQGWSRDMAAQQAEWEQQQIQNKMNAAQQLMQDDWHKLDLEHQELMANLMYELEQKKMWGDDWQGSQMGEAEYNMIMNLLNNPDISEESQAMLESLLRSLYGDDLVQGWIDEGEADRQAEKDKNVGTAEEGQDIFKKRR